jgi:hypothetical protein
MPRRRRGLRWRRGELRWRKVGLRRRGRHALPWRSGRRPAGIRLQRREIRGRPLLGRHVGPAVDAEPDRLLRQRLPTRRAPASHGPSQIRPARTAPRGAWPGIAAGVTGHLGPASIPAPGDHSPPGQDSPLEQELNGVLDDQQRICNRRRVSHPRHQYSQQAAPDMLVRIWPARSRTSAEGCQAGRGGRGQDGGTETPHKPQDLRTGGLS